MAATDLEQEPGMGDSVIRIFGGRTSELPHCNSDPWIVARHAITYPNVENFARLGECTCVPSPSDSLAPDCHG